MVYGTTITLKVFEKGKFDRLNLYLTTSEVECKCRYDECKRTIFNISTIESFYDLRRVFGKRIWINSGYRCQKHNKAVGGLVNSFHLLGCALDIKPDKPEDYENLLKLARKFFDVVVPYKDKGFIHVHNLK